MSSSSSSSSANDPFDKLRIRFQDVVSATNNFASKNLINEGETANVYKGELLIDDFSESIQVAVRRVRLTQHRLTPNEFLKEIKELFGVKHKNIISIVGFCDENGENIVIMEYAVNGSLDQYLTRDPTTLLTWYRRLKICLGVTRGFESISEIFNSSGKLAYKYLEIISCSKVLLDQDWEAKISCFGLRLPNQNKYGDMIAYPLGQMFLQVLFLREAAAAAAAVNINSDPRLVAAMVEHDFRKEKLEELMDPALSKQIHPLSFSIFLNKAYQCLTDRYMHDHFHETADGVLDALEVQLRHENIEKNMAHLKIPHSEIEVATGFFSKRYLIYSEPYEKLYKAELGPLDRKSCSWTIEQYDKNNLFKRQFTVAIQCIFYDEGRPAEWFFEGFEMLTSCKHHNIASLLGFSWEGSQLILVFEYPLKGSIHDYLGSPNRRNRLTWEQRVVISFDIALGLDHIHNMKNKLLIKHRGMTSASVFLDDKWNAKIVSIKLVKRYSNADQYSYGEGLFIYSIGVLLFEILFGRLADDAMYLAEKVHKGLEHITQSLLDKETRWLTVDQNSWDALSKIAYQCVNAAETQAKHPTMDLIVKELQKASNFQISQPKQLMRSLTWLKIPLSKIKSATNNFDKTFIIGSGGYAEVYKAELDVFDGDHERENKDQITWKQKTVAIKRIFIREDEQGKEGFFAELNVLSTCKHPNIVSLLGYCEEDSELILVYEHVAMGSLDNYLGGTSNKNNFTWSRRIKVCLDIAYGIDYLHSTTKNKETIIHRDIKSDNILLGDNWEVKIADFGLSRGYPTNQSTSTIFTNNIAGTDLYMDPTYERHRMLKKESDIYSFGVVLFEILSGTLAYDYIYRSRDTKGLAPIARKLFKQGTLNEMVDPEIMKEADEVLPTLQIASSKDSVDIFLKIAYKCLAKTQDKRPTIKDIIKELQKALRYQEQRKGIHKISLEDIKLGTENFSDKNCIITGEFWKVYSGEIQNDGERMSVFIKRFSKSSQKDAFMTEYEILYKHKHKNVICVVGYCVENDEKIIVHEHARNGNLSMHMNNVTLRWLTRLEICYDVAVGLCFLHEDFWRETMVVHRDVKSSSILLNNDYEAKISDFGHSLRSKNKEYAVNDFIGTPGYCEYPLNMETGFLSKESDIYSFGVILFETLSGRLTSECYNVEHCYLDDLVKKHFEEGKLDELVFHGIKEQIAPLSLDTFQKIAYKCLSHSRQNRPKAYEVVAQLLKAIKIQEKWEHKLPEVNEDTIQLSEPSIDSNESKNKIYMFPKEILLLQYGKWSDEERSTEMVSATKFSYINNHLSHRWRSLQESRFQKVAEMLDTSNLMIEIETKTQYSSGDHGVYLVFKFCDSRKFSSQPMYVNLKYRTGSETLHAYFATWRDDEWMMIELFRTINHKEDIVNYKFLLESFSPCYCGDDAIYVEGIEFRAIENVMKNDEIKVLQGTQQVSTSNLNVNQVQQLPATSEEILGRSMNHDDQGEKNIWQSEVNGKIHLMLPAKEVLLNYPNVNLFTSKPSIQSRFEEEIELLAQQVFYINCTFKCQILSHVCYLVFKLSENCNGLHYPVKVRDLLQQENKEGDIIYFIPPSPWNIHVISQVPKPREDGLMEVIVWKSNLNHQLENECVPVNLKLMSYEGSMAGLIICGLELRQV